MNPTESRQMQDLIVALIGLSAYAWCYARGGRSATWLRRFLGAWVFVGTCVWLAKSSGVFHAGMLGAIAGYPLALSLGYGGETTASKVLRRMRYGAILGAMSGWFLVPIGQWGVLIFQVVLSIAASVLWGVRNPTSAVGEEGTIAVLSVGCVPFMLIR